MPAFDAGCELKSVKFGRCQLVTGYAPLIDGATRYSSRHIISVMPFVTVSQAHTPSCACNLLQNCFFCSVWNYSRLEPPKILGDIDIVALAMKLPRLEEEYMGHSPDERCIIIPPNHHQHCMPISPTYCVTNKTSPLPAER